MNNIVLQLLAVMVMSYGTIILQQRFLMQHSIAMLEQRCNHPKQCCESSHVTSPLRKDKGCQRAKKVGSNSPGLVDFAIALVNSVFKWPDGQVKFLEEFE